MLVPSSSLPSSPDKEDRDELAADEGGPSFRLARSVCSRIQRAPSSLLVRDDCTADLGLWCDAVFCDDSSDRSSEILLSWALYGRPMSWSWPCRYWPSLGVSCLVLSDILRTPSSRERLSLSKYLARWRSKAEAESAGGKVAFVMRDASLETNSRDDAILPCCNDSEDRL